ncbi:MAG: integrase core domain-containing protein [Saprospiraceae bacterium]
MQSFFKENYLNQVFTHPYSPQENGHVESFHKTLGGSLKNYYFENLDSLARRLNQFYKIYNNDRQHSSIAGLSPSKFWALWEDDQVIITTYDKKKATFKLKIPYQDVLSWVHINRYSTSGNGTQKASLVQFAELI